MEKVKIEITYDRNENGQVENIKMDTHNTNGFEVIGIMRVLMDWVVVGTDMEFAKEKKISKYRASGMTDKNGVEILEGSVINADGYKSRVEENHFHCVMYRDGIFGCDIYSDFEPLKNYREIEVVGHAEDFREVYENGEWSGNLGEGLL